MKRVVILGAAVIAAVGGLAPAALVLGGGSAYGSSNLCVSVGGATITQSGTANCGTTMDKKSVAVSKGSGTSAFADTGDRSVAVGSGSSASATCILICSPPTNSSAVATAPGSHAVVDGCGFGCSSTKNSAVATTPGCTTGHVVGRKQNQTC